MVNGSDKANKGLIDLLVGSKGLRRSNRGSSKEDKVQACRTTARVGQTGFGQQLRQADSNPSKGDRGSGSMSRFPSRKKQFRAAVRKSGRTQGDLNSGLDRQLGKREKIRAESPNLGFCVKTIL